jgi:hypothetical protein
MYDLGSLEKLIAALEVASRDSGKMARRIAWLTAWLVVVGCLQAIATAWPYLVWAWHHHHLGR